MRVSSAAEKTHEIIAVVVTLLLPHLHLRLVEPGPARCLDEVLRQQLTVFVELVCSALQNQHR